MKRGDLGKLLRDKKCLEVDWLMRGRQIITGIAEGLYFLHSQARPIVHRDVRNFIDADNLIRSPAQALQCVDRRELGTKDR